MTTPNLKYTATDDGFLVTADASRPAPEFASVLKSLANPCRYGGIACHDYRRWLDALSEGLCGSPIDYSAPHWVDWRRGDAGSFDFVPVTRISGEGIGA